MEPTLLTGVAVQAGDAVLLLPGAANRDPVAAASLEAMLADGLDAGALTQRGWHYRPSVNARIPVFN